MNTWWTKYAAGKVAQSPRASSLPPDNGQQSGSWRPVPPARNNIVAMGNTVVTLTIELATLRNHVLIIFPKVLQGETRDTCPATHL